MKRVDRRATSVEEALEEAIHVTLEQWPGAGAPGNPRAWLISTGRFNAIDAHRKLSRLDPLPEAA